MDRDPVDGLLTLGLDLRLEIWTPPVRGIGVRVKSLCTCGKWFPRLKEGWTSDGRPFLQPTPQSVSVSPGFEAGVSGEGVGTWAESRACTLEDTESRLEIFSQQLILI